MRFHKFIHFYMISRALLIQQSECPKGNLVQVTIFDVVFDHIGKYNKTALKKQQFRVKTA